MKIRTYCEFCTANIICNTKTDDFSTNKYDNIILIANCDDLRLTSGLAFGLPENFEKTFTHCDSCLYKSRCKYYPERDKITEEINKCKALIGDEFNVFISCNSYTPNEHVEDQTDVNNDNTSNKVNSKNNKSIFRSLFKKIKK